MTEEKKGEGFKGETMIVLPTEVFSDYAKHPLVRRLYLTDVGFFPQASHHYKERRDGIEEYILIYCTEGRGVIKVAGKEYVLKKNEAFCIPRFQNHCYYACKEDPWSILWVHFKGEDTVSYPLEECQIISFESSQAMNRVLYLFESLFHVLEGTYTLGNFVYLSQVLSLILAETYAREKEEAMMEKNKYVTNIVKYMYAHLEENLTLDVLVEQFELSKSYLNAIFLKYTQHTPMDFYIHLKMREACKLLKTTDIYVYEVSIRLGYQDPYYFSRIFKKIVGISPKEYKQSEDYVYKE